MDVADVILRIALIIVSLLTIGVVLLQSEKGDGGFASAFTGGQSNFMSSGKVKGYESRLVLVTKVLIGILIVVAIAMAVIPKLVG